MATITAGTAVPHPIPKRSEILGRAAEDMSHDFYPGGRHEMLNEINRVEVRANLLRWISSVLERHISSEAS
jgi:alpha-beta hydrolase superfamily lysophospholipase